MRGEEPFEPALVLALFVRQAHEGLLQRDGAGKIEAGAFHVDHAVMVGFAFLVAPEFHLYQLRAQARALQREIAEVAVHIAGRHAHLRCDHAHLQQRAALLGLGAVARRRVRDLVAQHGRQLRFTRELGQQAPVDCHLAARQRPGVGHRAVEHHELIGQLAVRDGGQFLPDTAYIGGQFRVDAEIAALALAHGRVVLGADAQLRRFGNELDLALVGDWIGAAGGQQADAGSRQDQFLYTHGEIPQHGPSGPPGAKHRPGQSP